MYVDATLIAAAHTVIFGTGIKIRPETWIPAFAGMTHLLRSKRFERLNIFNVLNRSILSERPDLLHARIEADVLILGRISQDPYRVFAVNRSIDGFFDHRAQ
jgi:hypothetical protein